MRGVFLHTHPHYRLAADHLVGHFVRYPADPPAVLLVSAFALASDLRYREQATGWSSSSTRWLGRRVGRGGLAG